MHIRRSFWVTLVLAAFIVLAAPQVSPAAIVLSINIAPPPLPVYVQPACPGPGYMWVPGYWAYDDGYFWVPGAWVLVPELGYYWTPGYWSWDGALFVFHVGYWGPEVGFYGGINYGFGYTGVGYQGGYWNHGTFFYNRAVTNVGSVRNVYSRTVTVSNSSRVSFNGGRGGINARPTAREMAAAHQRHIGPTRVQTASIQSARRNRQISASANHGRQRVTPSAPAHAPTPRNAAPAGRTAANRAAPAHPGHRSEADRMVRPQPTTHAHSSPQPHHPANVRTPAPRQAQVRPEPNHVHNQPRVAQQRAPHNQAHIAQARPPRSVPPVAQQRPPAAHGPVQQRSVPRSQPMAHAAPRPQPRPAAAPHNAGPERKKS